MSRRLLIAMSASALAFALAVPATFVPTDGARAQVAIGISVAIAPPTLPDYDQPPLPGPGYVWSPGYWAWDPDEQDYYWVPGAWVEPPEVGLLWTPPYWGWSDGVYVFHTGYWGSTVGFYGGVDYGYGYGGDGYDGGSWRGGAFFYNTAVTNIVNVHIVNVYTRNVVVRNTTKVSYAGGPGGIPAKPTPAQLAVARGPHIAPTAPQLRNLRVAQKTPTLHFKANKGQPPVAAVERPGVLKRAGRHIGAQARRDDDRRAVDQAAAWLDQQRIAVAAERQEGAARDGWGAAARDCRRAASAETRPYGSRSSCCRVHR